MIRKRVHTVLWNQDTDPAGNPLALVIYSDRSCEYVAHDEF